MRTFRCFLLALALAAPFQTRAAAPEPKGLMAMLQKGMTGHAVIAAGTGGYRIEALRRTYDAAEFAAAKDEVARLQVTSKAASGDDLPLIPFAVGKAWVIAPQFRQDARADLSSVTPLSTMSVPDLLTRAVLALSAEQMEAAGDGIPFARLPAETQRAMMAALPPPFTISTPQDLQGEIPGGWAAGDPITQPIDWPAVRFRARLRLDFPSPGEPGATVFIKFHPRGPGPVPTIFMEDRNPADRISIYDTAPNTLRASDLDTRGLDEPIGVAGVMSTAEAVARLTKVTGLPLSAMPAFHDAPVFIGREDMSCADVAEGLRLAVTGTWRRVGDNYVLAWDTPGWEADRLRVGEALADAVRAGQKLALESQNSPAWVTVAEHLKFNPDDPVAPTEKQRRILFALDVKPPKARSWEDDAPGNWPADDDISIPFQRMTAEQKRALREAARSETVTSIDESTHEVVERPVSPADIQNMTLTGDSCVLEVSLDLPGIGWVVLQPVQSLVVPAATLVLSMRVKGTWMDPSEIDNHDQPPVQPKPAALPTKSRGLVVPALGPSEITTVIGRMKAHGLDTLLYPALDGGYATFPSEDFPLAPSLRGKSGWAAAAAAAKANGIRLVAWLSPAGWRNEGQKVHWLDARRELMDVDALGRTPTEWRAQRPTPQDFKLPLGRWEWPMPTRDYVRPADPEVSRRLDRFVSEIARLPGAAGLAILDWSSPDGTRDPDGTRLPALGFALPDRIAALAATGADPVDDDRVPHTEDYIWRAPDVMDLLETMDEAPPTEPRQPMEGMRFHDLAARVLSRAKAVRKDWRTWRIDTRPWDAQGGIESAVRRLKPPAADVTVSADRWVPHDFENNFVVTVPPRSARVHMDGPEFQKQWLPAAIVADIVHARANWIPVPPNPRASGAARPAAAVGLYDFRQCPEDILESLRWIAAPKPAAK